MAMPKLLHLLPVFLLTLAGCGGNSAPVAKAESTPEGPAKSAVPSASPAIPKAPVSDRKGNTDGSVFIVEYHHIRKGKTTMERDPADFKKDLESYYKLGFRPCTVSEYLSDKMDLAPGASPMVFTFDDANPSQFQLLPDGSVDPSCAVGIWQAFAKEHPDFPIKATFYVLPTMWGQPNMVQKKVEMLRSWGCELGNHTITHPILRKQTDERVKQELAEASDNLEKLGEKMPPSLALPFGSSPKNASLTHEFDYKGKHYTFKGVMLVGADPAPAPGSKKLNIYRIPRVQACKGPYGIEDWLAKLEKGQVKPYVQP